MSYELCLGRDCKLGWKYDKSLNLLIDTKKEYKDIKLSIKNNWEYSINSLSASNIQYLVTFLFVT